MSHARDDSALTTGSALFLAAQCPPNVAGIVLLAILAVSMITVMPGLRSATRASTNQVGDLRADRVLAIVAALGVLVLVQWLWLPNELKPLTSLHLMVYAVVALGRRHLAPSWPSLRLVRGVTILNAVLLLTYYVEPAKELFWYENLDQLRFRSYYFEPSVAALMCALNILILWFRDRWSQDHALLLALNFACLALTYSGSGFLVLGAAAISQLSWVNLVRGARLLLVLVPLLVWWINSSTAIDQLIFARAAGIIALDYDNSVHLRAVAPLLFLSDLLNSGVHAWLGAGLGGIESFILQRPEEFWYLSNFNGDLLTDINNGYVVTIALVGVPVALISISVLIRHLWHAPVPRGLKIYVLLYPLFSGFVIHPLLWLLIAMLGLGGRHRRVRISRLTTSCALPS